MHCVAKAGNLTVVKILVEEFGVDLAIKSESGLLASDYAAAAGHTMVTKYLQSKLKEQQNHNAASKKALAALNGDVSTNAASLGAKIPRSLAATLDVLKKSIADEPVSLDWLDQVPPNGSGDKDKEGKEKKTTSARLQSDGATQAPSTTTTTTTTTSEMLLGEGASTTQAPPSPSKKRRERRKKKRMSTKMANNQVKQEARKSGGGGATSPVPAPATPDDKKSGLGRFSSIKRFATFQMRVRLKTFFAFFFCFFN